MVNYENLGQNIFKHSVSSDWSIGSDHPSVESCITSQS